MRMQFKTVTTYLVRRPAERLVLTGLRCWMAGYEHGDIECWETAWRAYSNELGPKDARAVLSELQYWVRTLREVSVRRVHYFPHCCRYVCEDECAAVTLLAAYQHQDLDGARAAAHKLSGLSACPSLDMLTEASCSFAGVLAEAGQSLLPVPAQMVEPYAIQGPETPVSKQTKH